jgi:hypothetical protein
MLEWAVFLLVFFLYVHIVYQYKSSDEMDIYEMDYVDNANLQETCNLLQPFVFSGRESLPSLPTLEEALSEKPEALFHLYDDPKKDPISLPMSAILPLLQESSTSRRYYSEHNQAFFQEVVDFQEKMREVDPCLQPPFTAQTHHDVCIGSVLATTPLKYHVNTRKFLVVSTGKIQVKMTPWKKHRKYIHEIRDYDIGEYRSGMDVWDPAPHHQRDCKKLEFLEFDVSEGQVLYIPPYWGYSLRYQEPKTCVFDYTYSTWFNRIAFLGEIGRTWLQQQNIYQKVHRSLPPLSYVVAEDKPEESKEVVLDPSPIPMTETEIEKKDHDL